jgi:hypothetical protein
MREWTGIELREASDTLESGAATLLGRMLFEFSRLDMALGLCLVWADNAQAVDKLTLKVAKESFALKVNRLEKLVMKGEADGSPKRTGYVEWIADIKEIRTKRNDLVHGRWGIDPVRDKVINVVGLPTSPDQQSTEYSLADLEGTLTEMKRLQERLSELLKRWPL